MESLPLYPPMGWGFIGEISLLDNGMGLHRGNLTSGQWDEASSRKSQATLFTTEPDHWRDFWRLYQLLENLIGNPPVVENEDKEI